MRHSLITNLVLELECSLCRSKDWVIKTCHLFNFHSLKPFLHQIRYQSFKPYQFQCLSRLEQSIAARLCIKEPKKLLEDSWCGIPEPMRSLFHIMHFFNGHPHHKEPSIKWSVNHLLVMLEGVLWLSDPWVAQQWHHKVHSVPAVNTNNWQNINIIPPHQYQRDMKRETIGEDLCINYDHVELEWA